MTTKLVVRTSAGALAGLLMLSTALGQQVISLYPGAAPGSETWTQRESISPLGNSGMKVVRNIVHPTLTVYLPKENATGAAMIVAPGGGFLFLSWESEGTRVAEWLAGHGIAAFVLKYRVTNTGATEEEFQGHVRALFTRLFAPAKPGAPGPTKLEEDPIVPLAAEDGRQAVILVRRRAAEWKIAPDRIGIMGFSAGAMVTDQVVLHHTPDSRPNFAAPIYGPPLDSIAVPGDAPPLFILCADDDQFAAAASARLYLAWHTAGKPAELHIYSKGGHGFGMQARGLPVDHWIEHLGAWLKVQGFLTTQQ